MRPRTPEPPDFPASQLFLRRLAYNLVHDEARAEDLVQDTWAAWIEHRPSGVAEPRAWLARVLRNRAFNQKRTDERRSRRENLAGRPDPSAPETDGTLEAQAQLLQALRRLDEPYRSTLVQRYYHDLAPKEIAERAGAPLNTVKARLARGLEKLRAEMDRRYHGDRKAWCHWLTVLGAPGTPLVTSQGTEGAPLAPAAAGTSLVGWLGVAALVAAAGVWKAGWLRGPTRGPGGPPTVQTPNRQQEPEPARLPDREHGPEREHAPAGRPRATSTASPAASAPPSVPDPVVTAPPTPELAFDWPQYGGGPEHDTRRVRPDGIRVPKVLWFVPGCAGQPTLSEGELYTGGLTVAKLDPATGTVLGFSTRMIDDLLRIDGLLGKALDPKSWQGLSADELHVLAARLKNFNPNDLSLHSVAPAPVVTPRLVLARRTRDGGVTALDRALQEELWSWEPDFPARDSLTARLPLCLTAEGLVLVVLNQRLVALRVKDGLEAWTFTCDGQICMLPASTDGRVFVGTDRGVLVALDAKTGRRLWQAAAEGFGATPLVVVGDYLLVAEERGLPGYAGPSSDGSLRAFGLGTGRAAWSAEFVGLRLSALGVSESGEYAVAGAGSRVVGFDLNAHRRDPGLFLSPGKEVSGAPLVIGDEIVSASLDGRLTAYSWSGKRFYGEELRWTFEVRGEVQDFVHTGSRIYVATSLGLFCLVDDPLASGTRISWNGDPREPEFAGEIK